MVKVRLQDVVVKDDHARKSDINLVRQDISKIDIPDNSELLELLKQANSRIDHLEKSLEMCLDKIKVLGDEKPQQSYKFDVLEDESGVIKSVVARPVKNILIN